jgi:antitoxin CptB
MNLENIEDKRKRLIYRSWHRGTREMDLLLGTFADKNVQGFTKSEIEMYEALLEQNDPDLYGWITGQQETPANVINDVFERLKSHKYA